MAESFEPVLGERRVSRYDWDTWFARPFRAWVLSPGVDFDVDPVQMQRTVSFKAIQFGFKAVVSARDPSGLGRLWLCAYTEGDPKPKAWQASSYAVTPAAADAGADVYECCLCGEQRAIIPWFAYYDDDAMHQIVLECVDETGIGTYTAPHRDIELPVVSDDGMPIVWDWSKEAGPTRR